MKVVRQFSILLSAPGDMTESLNKVRSAIDQFNHTVGKSHDISLSPIHWSLDSFPEHGNRPQEILNNQIVRDSDAVIGLFGTRFGSPTGKFESGTEEEIEEMIAANKQIFLYFSDIPHSPSEIDVAQLEQVKLFKDRYRTKGLYSTFSSYDDLEKRVLKDLTLFFLQVGDKPKDSQPVSVISISSSHSTDESSLRTHQVSRQHYANVFVHLKDGIATKIGEIEKIEIPKPLKSATPQNEIERAALKVSQDLISQFNRANTGSRIAIDADDQRFICGFTEATLNRDLDASFFDLGDLSESPQLFNTGMFASKSYYGSEVSQKKFTAISSLIRSIEQYNELDAWLKQFEDKDLLQLVLHNRGSHFDEDITVDLFFPSDSLVDPLDIEAPGFEASDFVTGSFVPHIFEPPTIFGIDKYSDYPEHRSLPLPAPYLPLPKTHGEKTQEQREKFEEKIESLAIYKIHSLKDKQVVSCDFRYLRHQTSMYFPSILILKKCEEIEFRIRSKHAPRTNEGRLIVKR